MILLLTIMDMWAVRHLRTAILELSKISHNFFNRVQYWHIHWLELSYQLFQLLLLSSDFLNWAMGFKLISLTWWLFNKYWPTCKLYLLIATLIFHCSAETNLLPFKDTQSYCPLYIVYHFKFMLVNFFLWVCILKFNLYQMLQVLKSFYWITPAVFWIHFVCNWSGKFQFIIVV